MLDARDPAAVKEQHVPLPCHQLCDLRAEVRREPVEHDDNALLGACRRLQCPLQELQHVLCPIGAPLLELNQQPRRRGQASTDAFTKATVMATSNTELLLLLLLRTTYYVLRTTTYYYAQGPRLRALIFQSETDTTSIEAMSKGLDCTTKLWANVAKALASEAERSICTSV